MPDRAPIKLEVGLPGIALLKVEVPTPVRRQAVLPGPFAIISRDSGLALDTAFKTHNLSEPIFWPAHAFPQQLWRFLATGAKNEYVIESVANGLVLDARTDQNEGRHPCMWPRHGEAIQCWRLHPTGDGAAYIIESVATGHVLDRPADAGPRSQPVLWGRHSEVNQQFLIVNPAGGPVRATNRKSG